MIRSSRRSLFGASLLGLSLSACGGSGGSDDGGTGPGTGNDDAATQAGTNAGPGGDQTSNTDDTNGSPTSNGTADGTSGDDDTSSDDTGVPACPYDAVDGTPEVTLELVGSGFVKPVLAIGDPTQPDRLFVVEQIGNVKVLEPGQTQAPAESFLTVETIGGTSAALGDERGLFGFAFHPDYPDDPRVYVSYTETGGATAVDEYQVGGDGAVDPSTVRKVIAVDQPDTNHNGGMIAFGDDGYLYLSLGDGGDGNDSFQTSQDPSTLLSKLIRIGVEPDGEPDTVVSCDACSSTCDECRTEREFDYTIPADNPFVGEEGYAPEIYAEGFRNPWRFSFDQQTGNIYLGDVGQGSWEEVDVVQAGRDYGWSTMEGNHCFPGSDGCDVSAGPNEVNADGLTAPIAEYASDGSASVIALSVYRSCEVPAWDGVFFYGDLSATPISGLVFDGSTVDDLGVLVERSGSERLIGNGWNAWGDVYLTVAVGPSEQTTDGRVYRVAPAR